MLPAQISPNYVSANFLRIADGDYKDFLLQLPLFSTTSCFFLDQDFKQRDHFGSFNFRGQFYDFCLRPNHIILDDGRKVRVPLPNDTDNNIKNIILESLSLDFKAGGHYDIEPERISQLINVIRKNAVKIGEAYSVDQVVKCLVKLENVHIYIKRKQHAIWYPVSWIISLDFGPLDYPFYETLNET